MRNSQKRIIMDMSHITSDEFIMSCRNQDERKFIRNRKMPLQILLLSMINRKGLSLALELRNFMKIVRPGEHISNPGYLKQRMKLNPDAFCDLYHFHNKNYYLSGEYNTYNGHLILAVDGSNINLPRTKENLEVFGTSSRHDSKPQPALGLSCIYDVMNKIILESDCNRGKFNEMQCAELQMNKLPDTIGTIPYIIVMDRGYPSIPAFIHMNDKNINYLVRIKSCDFKEERRAMLTDDEIIAVQMTKSRLHHYVNTEDGNRMQELSALNIRTVNIKLDENTTETLMTNLPIEQFDTNAIKELYHMRWGIETAYETLKSRLQLENFTGVKPVIILQDIYSTIYVSNIAQDIIQDAEKELDKKELQHKHKMKINQTLSIGMLKNDLIYIILEANPEKKKALFENLFDEISQHLVPVRPERHYKRTKGQLAGRYSNTHKRAF